MKFAKIKRPKIVRGGAPRIVRRKAEICPHCGAVEHFKVLSTQRRDGAIIRYSVCLSCGGKVTRIFTI